MRTVENVVNELAAMTPQEMATLFESRGIKGKPLDSGCCPVANFVKAETKNFSIRAYPLCGIEFDADSGLVVLDTPSNIRSFMMMFDRENFPALIEN